jgi:hypothetical protein
MKLLLLLLLIAFDAQGYQENQDSFFTQYRKVVPDKSFRTLFWVVKPCSLVDVYRCFRGLLPYTASHSRIFNGSFISCAQLYAMDLFR